MSGDTSVDWATVRLQYEMFGASLGELAEQYCLSLSMLEYAREEGKWKRIKIAAAAQEDWHDIEKLTEVGDGLIDEVQERLRIVQTVKEAALSPRYIMLETSILSKAREVLASIHPEAPNAGAQLKTITEVLSNMREQNEALRPTLRENGSQGGGNSLKIQILGRVNEDGTPQIGAQVEISRFDSGIGYDAAEIGQDCSPTAIEE